MSRAASEIARLVAQALGNFSVPASQIIDQLPGSQVAPAASGSHGVVGISDATPQPLGTAAPGTTGTVSDAGHVHPITTHRSFRVIRTAISDTIATGTTTKVLWTTESYDYGSTFDLANSRHVPPAGTLWEYSVSIMWTDTAGAAFTPAAGFLVTMLYRDGWQGLPPSSYFYPAAVLGLHSSFPGVFSVIGNGSDFYEIYVHQTVAASGLKIYGNPVHTLHSTWSGVEIGASA